MSADFLLAKASPTAKEQHELAMGNQRFALLGGPVTSDRLNSTIL